MPSDYQVGLTETYDRFFRRGGLDVAARADFGYANLGLFLPGTTTVPEACDNMMQLVVSQLSQREGLVLDVGCGLGGTTEFLSRYFGPRGVYGINLSEYQLEQCRRRVPEGHFAVMPAEQMTFPDAMFSAVVSVEAALHFKGRQEFLREAYRVLRPGGEIVVADMLFHSEPTAFRTILSGQECYHQVDDYRVLWERCGFLDVHIEDITARSWRAFTGHAKNHAFGELMAGRIDASAFRQLLRLSREIEALPVLAYVVAHGRKPA
jgi:MPBQ/MSBQ methyltransferase